MADYVISCGQIDGWYQNYLENYNMHAFCFNIRTLILSLPKKYADMLWNVCQNWVAMTSPQE